MAKIRLQLADSRSCIQDEKMEMVVLDANREIKIRTSNVKTDDKLSEYTTKVIEQRNKLIGKVNKSVRDRNELTESRKMLGRTIRQFILIFIGNFLMNEILDSS